MLHWTKTLKNFHDCLLKLSEQCCCESGQTSLFLKRINFFPQKAIEILFASADKHWLEDTAPDSELYLNRKMLTTVFNKVNYNWVIDLGSSRQRTFFVF